MSRRENLIVGLDIGTTKICAIVAERRSDTVEVIGVGVAPCDGLRKGVVVNIEATVASIRKAIEEAESMACCEIDGAVPPNEYWATYPAPTEPDLLKFPTAIRSPEGRRVSP